MDAETRRRAVIDLALEHSNLKQKAQDIGVIGFIDGEGIQMNNNDFLEAFGAECKVKKRKTERFPYEAYVEFYNAKVLAILTEEQFKTLGVAADE